MATAATSSFNVQHSNTTGRTLSTDTQHFNYPNNNNNKNMLSFDRDKTHHTDRGISIAIHKVSPINPNEDIGRLCKRGRLREALDILHSMGQHGIAVDLDTYCSLLQVCSDLKALAEGKEIHGHMVQTGFEQNAFLFTKLLVMYTNCGSLMDARLLFDKASAPNIFAWTAMIGGYARHGYCAEALTLFYRMQQVGLQADNFVFPCVLKACAGLACIEQGKQIHAFVIRNGFESDFFVGSSLVAMYAKCGCMLDARHVFDKMSKRNVTLWNSMIGGYIQNGDEDEALTLLCEMQFAGLKPNAFTLGSLTAACASLVCLKQGKETHAYIIRCGLESDVFIGSALVDMYSKCGSLEVARLVFDRMPQRDGVLWSSMIAGYAQRGHGDEALQLFHEMELQGMRPNLVLWNAIVGGYVQNGSHGEALQLFCQMQLTGLKPNAVTITSILPAYANLAALGKGKAVHAYIIRNRLESDVFVGSALVDMYAKCGSVKDARKVFDKMVQKDVVLWNAMIAGHAMHGHGEDALALFYKMQETGIKPDDISFIGVLSACSHAGLVDEGWQHLNQMTQFYHITPTMEHYACMVDLLGRAGRLEEAHSFISKIPLKPDAGVWGALLGACRIHCNIKLAELAAEYLFELDPENTGTYVLLSNTYATAGRWDDVAKVRKMMKDRGLKKSPGCSWIEVNGRVNMFLAGERSHPQTEEIYGMLETLAQQIEEKGYLSDTKFVLQNVEEEEKEHALWHHSEKLAVAFGLINTCHGTPIRIIKNLRVCGDCHTAIKFISKTVGREIFVRDTNRFHHFKDGQCSCRDYW